MSIQIGEYIEIYEKRISQVKICSDNIYTAQRAEGYEMSRFGSYLSALSAFLKNDPSMQALFQVGYSLFILQSFSRDHLRQEEIYLRMFPICTKIRQVLIIP